jgi:hypothetical protein
MPWVFGEHRFFGERKKRAELRNDIRAFSRKKPNEGRLFEKSPMAFLRSVLQPASIRALRGKF